MREAAKKCPHPLQVDLLTLKVVSESCVTWATFVPILVFLGLCSRLRPNVRDRHVKRQTHIIVLNAPYPMGRGIINHGIAFCLF